MNHTIGLSTLEAQSGITIQDGPRLAVSKLTTVDTAATQYINLFDRTSKLLLLHILLIILVNY